MTTYRSESLMVISYRNACVLTTYSKTLEGLRQEIDAANERAMKLGYNAEKWLIICEKVCTKYNDDGSFYSRETHQNVVEQYPQGLD